jgi:hypothetical protein
MDDWDEDGEGVELDVNGVLEKSMAECNDMVAFVASGEK